MQAEEATGQKLLQVDEVALPGKVSSVSLPQQWTVQCITAAEALPCLADLVKPGPTGTIASTAAAATAAHTALVKAAPTVAPAGLLASMAVNSSQSNRSISTVMQDLLRAAQKALASGLGDWHLQSIQDINPEFEQHVLMGALGPETLKHKHKLPEPQILHLYGLLQRHCTGFQQEVLQAVAGADHVEQLLAATWTAFAQLWDECVQVSFQGEVLAAIQELQSTYAALLDTQDVLAAVQQENAALKERCNEFVRANLDHMLAWRTLKAKADALEGEVAMLSSANTEVSLRSAAVNARNTQLTVQLEGLGARLAGAEQQIQDREAALANARAALLEKDSGLRRQEAQVLALGQQLVEAGQGSRRQDNCISQLERQLQDQHKHVQDAERRVADKQRAFNLLHADFVKQKAEAADAAEEATRLHKEMGALHQQLLRTKAEAAKAAQWQQRWEMSQMQVEDFAAANARARMRRHELVSSYWPVMARLNLAEDVVKALVKQLSDLDHEPAVHLPPRDSRAQELPSSGPAGSTSASGSSRSQQPTSGTATTTSSVQQTPRVPQQHCGDRAGSEGVSPRDMAAALQGVDAAVREELQQLRDSYLLLQDEYWRQKERLLAMELENSQLKVNVEHATAAAAQAVGALSEAQHQAAHEANVRSRLEADLIGCRSWIKELEKTEQQYLKTIREQAALEQAASSAQRQADEVRAQLAIAEANWRLSQAQAEAAGKERSQLLQQFAQELNRSNLVEQALQRVHKLEVINSRAVCAQLQQCLDQQSAELKAAKAQTQEAHIQRDSALQKQHSMQQQLQQLGSSSGQQQQQLLQAKSSLLHMLQRLEALEVRVSFVNSSSISSLAAGHAQPVDVVVEAAWHLLERLLVSLQCLAADAATISNAAMAAKVEVLVGAVMQGLEAAVTQQHQPGRAAAVMVSPAASLVVLRNAAGAASKQRCQEVVQQLSATQLQLAETNAQLTAAASAGARLQRALNLKTRAAASLERQLAAAESQLQQMQASQAGNELRIMQLQQELAVNGVDHAQLLATCTARGEELQAAHSRVSTMEAALQQLRGAAAAAESASVELTQQLQDAMAASRQERLAAQASQSEAAAAASQMQQLQQQVTTTSARVAELESEVKECRHKADICSQAARDAEYRAVETTTLLADVRRELDFSQRMLEYNQQPQQSQTALDLQQGV